MTPTRDELLALVKRGERYSRPGEIVDVSIVETGYLVWLVNEQTTALRQIAEAMETHVLVPREPTKDMIDAGELAHYEETGHWHYVPAAIYRAMLAAAQQGKE